MPRERPSLSTVLTRLRGDENRRYARLVALKYFLAAALWIVLSDYLVGLYMHEKLQVMAAEMAKGLFFVAVTSLLLFLLSFHYIRKSRRQDLLLLQIAATVATTPSRNFFAEFVRQLCETLQADAAFVAELLPERTQARTLAYYADGEQRPLFEYALEGTPCADVSTGEFCFFSANVSEIFPRDPFLSSFGASAYMGMPLRDRNGAVIGFVAVLSRNRLPNASEIEAIFSILASRAAAELEQMHRDREANERFEKISKVFDALNVLVTVSDAQSGLLLFMNRHGHRLAGRDWKGLHWNDILGPRRPPLPERETAVDVDAEPVAWEFFQESTGYWYQGINSYIPWMDGSVARLEIAIDITESRQIDELKREMVAAVSHEMRTPLTAILGFTELLLSGEVPADEQQSCLQAIYTATERLNELISNYLHLQQLTARSVALHKSRTPLAGLLQRSCDYLAQHFPQIACSVDCPAALEIDGNTEQLQELFNNLASNAAKFSPPDGSVELQAEALPQGVRVAVSDSGPGIPPEMRERIFEPFYRRDNSTRRRTGGIGLGLTLVSEIVAMHKGTIRVEENTGGGSRFIVELPTASSHP